MFFFKRAAVLGAVLLAAGALRALEVQYGTLFTVSAITLENGRPVLPLTRGKYANVRVLGRETYRLLQHCAPVCRQEGSGERTEIFSFRAAKTRPDMWIADVSVDGQWLLTFLVFKNKDGFRVIAPKDITVSDQDWLARVEQMLQAQARKE